jgi:excisionase family DNA binding protein
MTKHITPEAFDEAVKSLPRRIWGATALAEILGVSVDTVRRLADDPTSPIYRPSGRYFAFRHEIEAWLRTKRGS